MRSVWDEIDRLVEDEAWDRIQVGVEGRVQDEAWSRVGSLAQGRIRVWVLPQIWNEVNDRAKR